MPFYIGTSGFNYKHWMDNFYPKDLTHKKWLNFYSGFFNTVELNTTFYKLPSEKVFSNWYHQTPQGFLFSVKASRYITHIKRLKEPKYSLEKFFNNVGVLREKLGIVLFQLPPNFLFKKDTFVGFLKKLFLYKKRCAFEFRHESWFNEEVYFLLKKYNFSLVIADSPTFPAGEIITADYSYFRFHGGKILYGSEYSKDELKEWAEKIKKINIKNAYIYFNNDFQGFAIKNAKSFEGFLIS